METLNISAFEQFLKIYSPKNKFYTSVEEIELVETKLGIKDKTSDELEELRNAVVRYYTELLDDEVIYNETGEYAGRTEKYWVYMDALQSVTAVIDKNIYNITLNI